MSVSLSCFPVVLNEKSYQENMLKSSPVRGFYPAPHHYMDFLPRTHNLLDPLKSLGRLVSDTRASLPLNMNNPFVLQSGHTASVLHELCVPGAPYLSHMMPMWSKAEELAAVVTEHAADPLSTDFSSKSGERSTASSASTPPKEALLRALCADQSPQKKTATYDFSEEDLFMVLYGYSSSQERSGGHAISGVVLPENSGGTLRTFTLSNLEFYQSINCFVCFTLESHTPSLHKETLELPEGKYKLKKTNRILLFLLLS